MQPPEPEALQLPNRLLLGPGPTNFSQDVLTALSKPPLGYLDPSFLNVMAEVQGLLRYCFQTCNETTLAISGTGSAAMEAAICNVVEPGDTVLVAVSGYFGRRLVEMAKRYGADVRQKEIPWGSSFSLEELRALIEENCPTLVCVVMAETSTGALQPLEGLGDICHEHGALLLVDAVTGFCTSPLYVDKWAIDICYSCSQKGLSCCPGASPLTLNARAMDKVLKRKTPVANWYLDLTLLMKYWDGPTRVYHHTAPINLLYALREALRLIAEEGLEAVWARHKDTTAYFVQQLTRRNLHLHIPSEQNRTPAVTTVVVPEKVDAAAVCRSLLLNDDIEIGVGIGELAGKVWRIGFMGWNSKRENVDKLMHALEKHLSL